MKERPLDQYGKSINASIAITGMRKEEGGRRAQKSRCISQGKFNPLSPVSEQFENWVISKFDLKLCKLYGSPFNFKRTGCKGCPFNIDLQYELQILEKYLPTERAQCEYIFGPVYNEYRRLNYRLTKDEQLLLF